MKLQSFISSLLSFDTFSFVNIFYFNTKSDLEIFQSTTKLPRMIFNMIPDIYEIEIWGLHFNGSNEIVFQTLNFDFKMFSIIILNQQSGFDENSTFLYPMDFQGDSKLLVIFEDNIDFEVTELFIEMGLLNLIFISAKSFDENQEFFTFEIFPTFKIKSNKFTSSRGDPYINHGMNFRGNEISVVCPNDVPNCIYQLSNTGGIPRFSGIMLNILLDFQTFTNSNLKIFFEPQLKFEGLDYFDKYDIFAMTVFLPPHKRYSENYMNFHLSSYPLEMLNIFAVVPSAKTLDPWLYPFEPFSIEIWMALTVLVFYTTFLIKLSNLEDCLETGDYFTRILRLYLAQPIKIWNNHPTLWVFYILTIMFGFVINVWYAAILGSFMTTYLNEKPINSLEDLKARNIELICPNLPEYNTSFRKIPEIKKNLHMFSFRPFEETAHMLNSLNDRYAYLEDSNHWKYFMLPQMDYFKDHRLERLETNFRTYFLNFFFKFNSLYKNRLNRLIFLLKDVGLYQHYADSVFIDNLKFKFLDLNYSIRTQKKKVRVLEVSYFIYIFLGWILGIIISACVFCIEQYSK